MIKLWRKFLTWLFETDEPQQRPESDDDGPWHD